MTYIHPHYYFRGAMREKPALWRKNVLRFLGRGRHHGGPKNKQERRATKRLVNVCRRRADRREMQWSYDTEDMWKNVTPIG